MKNQSPAMTINSVVSIEPLLDFWEKNLIPECPHMRSMFSDISEKISQRPYLQNSITDIGLLNEHYDVIRPLMSAIFPPASFNSEIAGTLTPCAFEPFFVTPRFQQLFIDENRFLESLKDDHEFMNVGRLLKIYMVILERVYGISCMGMDKTNIKKVPDETTGLDRYYRMVPDFQFVRVNPLKEPQTLSDEDRDVIAEHITDVNVLSRYIDLANFEFSGFTVVRAFDVTDSEIISSLERDLIDRHAIFSSDGIRHLESRLQVLFQRPDMAVGIGAIQNDQVMIIKNDCNSNINCLFSNSHHIGLEDVEGSVWTTASRQSEVLRVPDLKDKPDLLPVEAQAVSAGVRSMLLSALSYQGEVIGVIEVFTSTPNDLGPLDTLLLKQVAPIFSVALKRGLDEMSKSVQSIIKEKCTAVHPSVEWRFEQAAFKHMERLRNGESSEMEPIIFKEVVPFYGQSDIRGSSKARNTGIQQDLSKQLTLAHNIMDAGADERPWPILRELKHRIESWMDHISDGVDSGDENSIAYFLNQEVAPSFDDLIQLGPQVQQQIKNYQDAIDPASGMIYNKQKDYEQSVSRLNEVLSGYLSREDGITQETFPHYFEKRQTDGVDYMMYVGSSMMKNQELTPFHTQNLTLWQLELACGLGWHTQKLQSELKVPLDTCHLILVNQSPLSIRFRFDEKRFDVDGAYDIRNEIIKSRIDKAVVKGSGERLTQPGRIAVVYAHPKEGKQIQQHIDFLVSQGKLHQDLEFLDIDDMPEVRGLKAIRVGINLKAMAKPNIIEMKAG